MLKRTDVDTVAAVVSSIPKLLASVLGLSKLRVYDYGNAGIAQVVVSDPNWRCHVDEVYPRSQAAALVMKQQGRRLLEIVCRTML